MYALHPLFRLALSGTCIVLLAGALLLSGCDSLTEPAELAAEQAAAADSTLETAQTLYQPEAAACRDDDRERCSCSSEPEGTMHFTKRDGYQVVVMEEKHGRRRLVSYALTLERLDESRAQIGVYKLRTQEPICGADEPVRSAFVRLVPIQQGQSVAIEEIGKVLTWPSSTPAFGVRLIVEFEPLPSKDRPEPTQPPEEEFMCRVPGLALFI